MSELRYIDLFAGAGGLSEGFVSEGFLPIAHVEADSAACYTLRTRAAYHYLRKNNKIEIYQDYLKGNVSRSHLYDSIPEVILNSVFNSKIGQDNKHIFSKIDSLLGEKSVDLIIGGPPCQAYSVVGRAPLKHKKNDERTKLYIQYGRFLKKYNPKVFVFENVPGLLSAEGGKYFKNLQKYYKSIGYVVEAQLLNSHDYSVIQNRERVIIVGWRKDFDFGYPNIRTSKNSHSRDDIFLDLPSVGPGENSRIQNYTSPPNQYLTDTALRNGVDFVSQHITRPHNCRDLEIYKLAIMQFEQGVRIKNNQIPDELRTQKNVTSFLDRFKVVGERPHTMIAHIAKDGHYYIHPDIKQLRSISVREAARIQSFPDDFYFEGTKEKQFRSSAFKQIGNAVPPLMAGRIAEKIREMLSNA